MSFPDRLRKLGHSDKILMHRPEGIELWTDIQARLTDAQRQQLIIGWSRSARTGDRAAFQKACNQVADQIAEET